MSLLEQNTEKVLRFIADRISDMIGDKYGFSLVVFPYIKDGDNEPGVASYISSVDRETGVVLLRHQANILERGLDIVADPNATKN